MRGGSLRKQPHCINNRGPERKISCDLIAGILPVYPEDHPVFHHAEANGCHCTGNSVRVHGPCPVPCVHVIYHKFQFMCHRIVEGCSPVSYVRSFITGNFKEDISIVHEKVDTYCIVAVRGSRNVYIRIK